ncbi:MAG: dockerin type I repeat-containing protein, partial [Firmicutes bacterium]|nr:dockerin type I repeat-containing protein [Bacillota bacterium]
YYLGFSGDGTVDPVDDVKYGDADCSGKVEAADAILVLQYVLNKNSVNISEQGMKNIKVRKDGVIDAGTATLILQKALVSTFKFEVEE